VSTPSELPTEVNVAAPVVTGATADQRFVPGTVLAGRYRIVAQVGKGGMGEVYRADDLRLGQAVALKFLPVLRGSNPTDLARLHTEVRLARQIAHPNVCRVFDIGDADGVPFLTMEFVDGEDLASLLTRIGRLPQDKALQVAHQLCAGLAEAHALGVLHRDLKPANIMIDGRGTVRITDFGLAVTAGDVRSEDAWAGTPAWMAPEQLAGEPATRQSDIYALGLVLFQLFTGKDAFPVAHLEEIVRERQKGALARISSVGKDVDPAVERIILHCLQRQPDSRPRTVLQVSAALPGGDPLAAAMAAGETPSPEMVAAAADPPLMPVGWLWVIACAIVGGWVVMGFLLQQGTLLALTPLDKSPEVMAEHARQIIARLGYTSPPADSAYWYEANSDVLRYHAQQNRGQQSVKQFWADLPSVWQFTYRRSPLPLVTGSETAPVSLSDPARDVSGMMTVQLDARGRLLYFEAVPPRLEAASTVSDPDWAVALTAAGIDAKSLSVASPRFLPVVGFDRRVAWDVTSGGESLHVSAAAYRGKPVFFRVAGPWIVRESHNLPSSSGMRSAQVFGITGAVVILTTLGAGVFLARKNMRMGRGDHKGAWYLASWVAAVTAAGLACEMHHVSEAWMEYWKIVGGIGGVLFSASFAYITYLAIEPYFRRRWPRLLVSWSRVLSGRFADPRVGRDVLVGCLAGTLMCIVVLAPEVLGLNLPRSAPWSPEDPLVLRGAAGAVAIIIPALASGPLNVLFFSVLLVVGRALLRRDWLAWVVIWIVITLIAARAHDAHPMMDVLVAGTYAALAILLTLRYGMFFFAVADSVLALIYGGVPSLEFSRWYVWPSVLTLVIVAALAAYGFRAALAGRPLFGRSLLEE
jgi:serine/threonine-protein kinase